MNGARKEAGLTDFTEAADMIPVKEDLKAKSIGNPSATTRSTESAAFKLPVRLDVCWTCTLTVEYALAVECCPLPANQREPLEPPKGVESQDERYLVFELAKGATTPGCSAAVERCISIFEKSPPVKDSVDASYTTSEGLDFLTIYNRPTERRPSARQDQ
ncbi:hypothetical protein Esti_001967 [Eimeria stiedai]